MHEILTRKRKKEISPKEERRIYSEMIIEKNEMHGK